MKKQDYSFAISFYIRECEQSRDDKGKKKAHWALNVFNNKHHWLEEGIK